MRVDERPGALCGMHAERVARQVVIAGRLDRDLVMSGVFLGAGTGELAIDEVPARERLLRRPPCVRRRIAQKTSAMLLDSRQTVQTRCSTSRR